MKLITLYRRYTSINYKNSLCSFATLFVISVTIFAIVAPFYIAFSLFSDLWSQYKVVYEQPDIRFEYKYIFTAEFTKSSAAEAEISSIDTKIVVCSSYKYLNKALNDAMECSMIKYWEKDTDFDHKTDQMALQMTVQSPTGYYLSDLNLFLQLDATLKKMCQLRLPAAVLLEQMPLPLNFNGGEIHVDASLIVEQNQGFYCPFFLRSIRSHFYHDILSENSSDIGDYELATIRTRLTNNPAYVTTGTPKIRWNRLSANEIQVNVNLNVNESIARYNVSYWQRLGLIWIQYLSILIVWWKALDKLMEYMFSRQMIKAWEVIPWKKIY